MSTTSITRNNRKNRKYEKQEYANDDDKGTMDLFWNQGIRTFNPNSGIMLYMMCETVLYQR